MSQEISVYSYSDYREFLGDWFWASKKRNDKMSFRFMSKHMGLKAPNHFHLVISKKRHLSKATLEKILKLLKLDPRERQFLKLLFSENIAKSPEQRAQAKTQIDLLRRHVARGDAKDSQLQVVVNQLAWYIKMGALVFAGKTRGELTDLVQRTCAFPVNAGEVEDALRILESSHLLRFDEGLSCFDESSVTTKWDLDRFEIKQHHLSNMRLAMQSVAWPIDQRFLSSVTIACDEDLYQSVIADVRTLCLSILERSNNKIVSANDAKKVVTLQLALFPYFRF